jgi:hypothetical protein
MPQAFDLSSIADGEPALYLRWTMGTTDDSWRYSGWNIDEVEIWGEASIPPSNHAPLANDLTVDTNEDQSLSITLSASDEDGDALSYAIVTSPTFGSLTGTAPDLVYVPLQDYHGSDSFSFQANDGEVDSNTASVSISVISVNDAPVAFSQAVTTEQDVALNVTLTASDVDDDSLAFSVIDAPDHGVLSGSGAFLTYNPTPGYYGPDSFSFRAHDGQAESNVATIDITVTAHELKLQLEAGWVLAGADVVTVLLDNTYVNPVVLCSVQYLHNTNLLLVRISNITTTSFDLRLEDPVGGAVAVDSVSYLVAEEGAWEVIP